MANGKEPALSVGNISNNDVMLGGDHPLARLNRFWIDASVLTIRFAFHPRSDTVSSQLGDCLSDQRLITFAFSDLYPMRAMTIKPRSAWLMLGGGEYDYAVSGNLAMMVYNDLSALNQLGAVFAIPDQFVGIKFTFPQSSIVNGWNIFPPTDVVFKWGTV